MQVENEFVASLDVSLQQKPPFRLIGALACTFGGEASRETKPCSPVPAQLRGFNTELCVPLPFPCSPQTLPDTAFGFEFFHCCAPHSSPVSTMCRWPALCLRALTVSVLERPAASWDACSASARTQSYLETSGSGTVSGGYVSVGETSGEKLLPDVWGKKNKKSPTI